MSIREIKGGVTVVEGITASGCFAGIKKNGRPDLALIFSRIPCTVAAVFTKNRCPAASIIFDKNHLRTQHGEGGQAIIANSGNANAATGEQGRIDTHKMAEAVAHVLGISKNAVYVASTGVIGKVLPIENIQKAIPQLAVSLSKSGGRLAAEAIMTTDLVVKEAAFVGPVGNATVRIGGMTKGSGMIHPNMATMLAFLTTDAAITPSLLQESLREVTDRTFNCTTVDGETSTNDLVILFANGRAGSPIRTKGAAYRQFVDLLYQTCLKLAKQIVKDGEGATKLIEVNVLGAPSNKLARQIAFSVGRSNLVKTAFFGQDANWGRVVAAIGNGGAKIDFDRLDIRFGKTLLLHQGVYQGEKAEASVSAYLKKPELILSIDLHGGPGSATVFTSDLSIDYIKINADYRS